MRIIAGLARGRSFDTLAGMDTRPTLDRIRESVFGILQFRLADVNVLDLFAGSGAMGFEALSRGAAYAHLNDANRQCAQVISRNAQKLGMSDKVRVTERDYRVAIDALGAESKRFDYAFLDPPYRSGCAQDAAERIVRMGLLAPDGVIIVEHPLNAAPESITGVMRVTETRKYGEIGITFLGRDE